jgi:hypothetical protein
VTRKGKIQIKPVPAAALAVAAPRLAIRHLHVRGARLWYTFRRRGLREAAVMVVEGKAP